MGGGKRISTKFRPDVQGLRALAIIPILLFHADIGSVAGGYLGVDIFFVISGFVITQSIVPEIDNRSFSLWTFYQRRASRILPALSVMLLTTLAAGCFLLLPNELANLSKKAVAAAAFVSNIAFYRTGYFSEDSARVPLLHTWSLGVEEQFYLIYPLLLLAAAKLWRRSGIYAAVLALVVGSFVAASALTLRGLSEPNFYLLPYRAWELGLGGMVALGMIPGISSSGARSLLAAAGLAMAVLGLLFVRAESFTPSPWALSACGGTMLMIAYGADSWTGRLLSLRPLQWIGAISYSLYLWHWPIIVYFKLLRHAFKLDISEIAFVIALSFAAAAISYYFVERPCQTALRRLRARPVVLGAFAGSVLVGLCAFAVMRIGLHLRHWDAETLRIARYENYFDTREHQVQFRPDECFALDGGVGAYLARCLAPSATRRNVIVFGDSHAAQYWRAIALKYPDVNVMQATTRGCFPIVHSPGRGACAGIVRYVLGPLAGSGRIDHVILAARWEPKVIAELEDTIRHFEAAHVKVTVIGPVVEYYGPFPLLLARALWRHDLGWLDRLRSAEPARLERQMRAIVARTGASYFSELDRECPADKCRLLAPDRTPMHFDYGHLTMSGANYVIAALPPI